jgi:hypothetical protein
MRTPGVSWRLHEYEYAVFMAQYRDQGGVRPVVPSLHIHSIDVGQQAIMQKLLDDRSIQGYIK